MDQYKPFNGRIRKVPEEIPGIKWYRVTCPEDCMESNPGVRATLARESTWWLVIGRRYRLLILTHGSLGQSFEILALRIGNIREPGALKHENLSGPIGIYWYIPRTRCCFSSEGDIANMLTKKHCLHISQCGAPCFTLIRNATCVWFHRKEFRFIFLSINSYNFV